MTSLVDVTVPPGVEAGCSLEFELNGTILFATVPEGMCEGMVFQVEVTDAAGAPEVITEYESDVAGEDLKADVVGGPPSTAPTHAMDERIVRMEYGFGCRIDSAAT